jgi:hypothetical protein
MIRLTNEILDTPRVRNQVFMNILDWVLIPLSSTYNLLINQEKSDFLP